MFFHLLFVILSIFISLLFYISNSHKIFSMHSCSFYGSWDRTASNVYCFWTAVAGFSPTFTEDTNWRNIDSQQLLLYILVHSCAWVTKSITQSSACYRPDSTNLFSWLISRCQTWSLSPCSLQLTFTWIWAAGQQFFEAQQDSWFFWTLQRHKCIKPSLFIQIIGSL